MPEGQWQSRLELRPREHPLSGAGELHCSFCGKSQSAVHKLVAGPGAAVAICNECVALCAEIVAEQ